MKKYTVALLGLGPRGRIHAQGFVENADRFELAAMCDLNTGRLEEVSRQFGVGRIFTDAETMLEEIRPDVFCFATLPEVRLSMIELAVRYGVKAIAFEKPMATSLQEARAIAGLCVKHGIKAIVSHQQKYLSSMQQLKRILEAGEIGQTVKIHATALPWASQLGTHFMDYMIWANGGSRGKWAVGHLHGKDKLSDSHPSSDYLFGQVLFENGVRGIIECGYLSPVVVEGDGKFWVNNRLTVYGTHGYVWADTDGGWGAFTRTSGGETIGGQDDVWEEQQHSIQAPYLKELADWLDNDAAVHSCNAETACHGYEILEGLCLSALDHTRVDLPLNPEHAADINERMRQELPEVAAWIGHI